MRLTKRVDLPLLDAELTAAAVPHLGLGTTGTLEAGNHELWTYDAAGSRIEPPPEAAPVVDAHVAPPLVVDYAGRMEHEKVVRTTDAAFHEVFRVPTALKHVYDGTFSIIGIDAGNGATKSSTARMAFKHTPNGLAQVGTTAVLFNAADSAAAGWAIAVQIQGTDLVIGVAGAAGRTIDWTVSGRLVLYAPEGL